MTLNLSKIEGHKGASIGFSGVIKKPLTKSPRSSIKTNIFYHDLLEGAFDQRFYDEGKYFVGEFSFTKRWIKNLFNELSQKSGSEVTLFPFIDVMRNYFSGPQCGLLGWHNDAGGEYPYHFCREKMRSGKYIFGKLSISLQPNGIYGGNIDIAKATYKKNEKK